jgi:hypothetical protein
MLLKAKENSGEKYSNACIPKKITDVDSYNEKMEKLEYKLIDETLKPFKPSGHAFVCFDSIKSVNICLNHFKMSPSKYVRLMC